MKKLTLEQIEEIKKLKKDGISTYEIAKRFNISQSSVIYHTNEEYKKRNNYESRKEYLRKYQNKRYHNKGEVK